MALTPEALVNKSLQLVSPPSIYLQITDLLQDPDSAMDEISAVIQTDPGLTTRLLRIVNSPFYGFPAQINTISRAITIVGTNELSHLVLATSVMDTFRHIPSFCVDMNAFWQHSFASAITSRLLAETCGQAVTEPFFIAGLLHNIGSLVLYQSLPEMAREAINIAQQGHEPLFKAEQRVFGFDHTQVGEALTYAWHLPESLATVTRYHHTPSSANAHSLMVAIVHLADIMVTSVPFGHAGDHHVPPLDPAAWQTLGLDAACIPAVIEQVAKQIDSLSSAMMMEH